MRLARFANSGLDSLMSVTLVNRLESALGIKVSTVKLIQGPSVEQLVDEILPEMPGTKLNSQPDHAPAPELVPTASAPPARRRDGRAADRRPGCDSRSVAQASRGRHPSQLLPPAVGSSLSARERLPGFGCFAFRSPAEAPPFIETGRSSSIRRLRWSQSSRPAGSPVSPRRRSPTWMSLSISSCPR